MIANTRQAWLQDLIIEALRDLLNRPMSPRNLRSVNATIRVLLARLVDTGDLPPGVQPTDIALAVPTANGVITLEPRGELRRWLEASI